MRQPIMKQITATELRIRGLSAATVDALAAYRESLATERAADAATDTCVSDMTDGEIRRLLFVRWLVQTGRITGQGGRNDNGND